jgi:hypothetical protein
MLTTVDHDVVTSLLSELGFTLAASAAVKVKSKQQLANDVLDVEFARATVLPRKDLITLLMSTCGMGKPYASTALQIYRESKGLVNHAK